MLGMEVKGREAAGRSLLGVVGGVGSSKEWPWAEGHQ